MKKLLVIFLILTFSPSIRFLYSQDTGLNSISDSDGSKYFKLIIRSAPVLTIELNGHYDFGVYELSANNNGDFSSSQFINGENFGVRHGVGGTAVLKYSLNEKGYLRLCGLLSFNRFSSKYSKYLESQNEAGYATYNVFGFGVGAENNFTPGYKFKPLVGIGIIGSIISGSARVYDKSSAEYKDLSIIPAFRMGLTVYSGVEYLLNNKIGLNCGIKLVHSNLWFKKTKTSDNQDEIYLNDERVVPRTPYSGFRQFMWGELYGGVNFYFGITEKDYIIKKAKN